MIAFIQLIIAALRSSMAPK